MLLSIFFKANSHLVDLCSHKWTSPNLPEPISCPNEKSSIFKGVASKGWKKEHALPLVSSLQSEFESYI